MYSKEQKDIALRIYHQTESVTETIRILGYPTRRNLYTWIAEENTPPKTRKEYPVINNPPDHLQFTASSGRHSVLERPFSETNGRPFFS